LFDLDDAMAAVVAHSTQPALGAIKLAWWRERLEELDQGKVPAEPRLQAAAAELLPRGVKGSELAQLEEGWTILLDEKPDPEVALGRGATLFALAARLLSDSAPPFLQIAGRLHAAGNLTRLGLAPDGVSRIMDCPRVPRQLRPLTGLAALAARDLRHNHPRTEREGAPGRALTLLRHRLTGRL
jgi:phytoene synthase